MEPEWDSIEEFRLRRIAELAPMSSWYQKTELFNMMASIDDRQIRSESGVKQKHQRIRNQPANILPALTQPVSVATAYPWPTDPSRGLSHEPSASNPWNSQVVTTASFPPSARYYSSTDPQAATEISGMEWISPINAVSFGSVATEPVTTVDPHIFTNSLGEQNTWIPSQSSVMTGGQPSTFVESIPIQHGHGQPSTFIEPYQIQHGQGQLGTLGLVKEDGESKEETADGPEEQGGSEDDNTDDDEEEEEEEEEEEGSKEEDERGAES